MSTHTRARAVHLNPCGGERSYLSRLYSRFPAIHFGKLYGLAMSISAVVSLLQYPCFTLVKGALHGDPFYVGAPLHHQCIQQPFHLDKSLCRIRLLPLQVDVALTLLTLLVFVHPVYTFVHCRSLARRRDANSLSQTPQDPKPEAKL